MLAEHRLTARAWSASALQRFAVCPYQFALGGIYGLRPREEASPIEQLDPLTRGALFHEAQFTVLTELKARGLLPVNAKTLAAALELCDAALAPLAARYEEELAPAIPRIWKSEIEDLRTDLRGWLQHAARNDDDWTPMHFEFGFGLADAADRDPASTSEEADLADIGVRLHGSIDLVEHHDARGVLRVTDHKTGKPPDAVPMAVGGGRFLQPLLYSLAAEKFFKTPVESGRLFYATQRGEYRHMTLPNSDRARLFVARLLANIDQAIAGGFLPPIPQSNACANCDYSAVCGPYEERRSNFKDRKDERVDGLIEIRGMA